jgi:hypothetical protein
MKAIFLRGCLLIATASIAACTTSGGVQRGVEVTSFHLGQAVARGPIAIEGFDPADENSLEFRTYAAAVERQLTRLGWTVVRTVGQSEQVAMVDVSQGSREHLAPHSPVSVGVGGGTGGWHGGGVGGGVSFGLGGGGSREVITNLLEVRIKRRSDGTIFWEGRASSEARPNSAEAHPAAAVERLAEALFRGFPGNSGETIRVQ